MDGPQGIFLVIACAIFGGLFLLFLSAGFDRSRIQDYFRRRGEHLLDMHWDPFGPGWFGEKDARIYRVRYRDSEGRTHAGHVKTSMWSGVYLTGNRVVKSSEKISVPGVPEEPELLTYEEIEQEKVRLRKRLDELDQMSERE